MINQVEVADTRLHVVRHGNGPPLLLLVGLGGRSDFWAGTIEHFAPDFDCISFDHRKTGKSAPSDVITTVEVLAKDAIALLNKLGLEKVDIIGHSLGGAMAQYIAVHAPERVNRLVLSATWAGPTGFFQSLFDHRKAVLKNCGPAEYLLQGNLLGNPGWWSMGHHETMVVGIDARLKAFVGLEIELERMAAVCGHDLRALVPNIKAKTLVVCAQDDSITPLPLSEELARLIPGARLEILPTGNHFAPNTTPESWRQKVEGFLRP